MRQFGALIELLGDHGVRQLRRGDQIALHLVRIGERPLPGLLVAGQYALDDRAARRRRLRERSIRPKCWLALAEEQLGAVLNLGGGHQRIKPRPGVDVLAQERRLTIGMLQQNDGDVLLGQAGIGKRANEENMRIGAARRGDALALEIGDLGDAGSASPAQSIQAANRHRSI